MFVEPVCPKVQNPGLDADGMPVVRSELPADFVTTWVLRCRAERRTKSGEALVVVERADTPATELAEQLRRPSDPLAELRANEACSMELVVPPYFLLVDAAGNAILPAIPTDGCGKPRRDATRALDTMTFRIVSTVEIGPS